jgi:hypothetical protein
MSIYDSTPRRSFITQLGALATGMALEPGELLASPAHTSAAWDTSWIARVESAQYRVVFNASDISDGAAMNYASTFFAHFHEVHDTADKNTRPVIVFRRLGTAMAFNDEIWNRYSVGEDSRVKDPTTSAPAKRNVFWTAPSGASPQQRESMLDSLHQRGLISLVCNVALTNWSRGAAERVHRDAAEVRADVLANLIPGAILVPSGIYALIRAQNAGCAYMPGT